MQIEGDALREDLTAEKQHTTRMAAELRQLQQQLAERTLERDRALTSLQPFLEARELLDATSTKTHSATNSPLLGRVSRDAHSNVLQRAAAREQLLKRRHEQEDWAVSHSSAFVAKTQVRCPLPRLPRPRPSTARLLRSPCDPNPSSRLRGRPAHALTALHPGRPRRARWLGRWRGSGVACAPPPPLVLSGHAASLTPY